MNEILDKKLCEAYPKIFVNRNASVQTTSMCWGFQHGDGWYNIINNLCRCIQHHIDSTNERRELLLDENPYNIQIPDFVQQVVAEQVKEKFGTLRFYYHGGDDIIDGMVSMAESMSAVTCEECGKPGYQSIGGWIVTLCKEHHEERELGK